MKSIIYAHMPVEALGLNNRAYNALKRAGITTIGQLFDKTFEEILDIHNMGTGTLGHILEKGIELDTTTRVELLEQRIILLEKEGKANDG